MSLPPSDIHPSLQTLPRHFTTTRWSLVSAATTKNSHDAHQALETLCRHYREPILTFIQRNGHQAHDAQDLTQQFFLFILTNNTLAHAQPERGKFRTFLLSCLKNFLINEHKHKNRLKRGGAYQFLEYDSLAQSNDLIDHSQASPDFYFDKRWAETVVENALQHLKEEWNRDNKPFKLLQPYLTNPKQAMPFSQQAQSMGVSEAALKSAVHRMRQRYGQLVKDEVTATVSNSAEIAEELRHLLSMLAKS